MTEQPMHDTIANRYEIKSRIGEGGMGTVYKAHDRLLEIAVAIKRLHQGDSQNAAIRFQNEAVALGKLNHPNIARILDFANDDGTLYMVMEYLEGQSLSEVIEKEQLSPAEATQIFIEIADGMAHAHKHGVLHRDLKPSNVILVGLDEKRIPKIIDFGIAKMQARDQNLTATGVGIGSPLYMSPEQARNANVDERADIYSFGCLMFETLTGMPPLRGDTVLETIQKQISEPPPRADEVADTLEFYEGLVGIIDRCLAKEPEKRPQKFSRLKDELEHEQNKSEHLQETPRSAQFEDGVSKNKKRKNSSLLPLSQTVALIVAIGFAISYSQRLLHDQSLDHRRHGQNESIERSAGSSNTEDLNSLTQSNTLAVTPQLMPDGSTYVELKNQSLSDNTFQSLCKIKTLKTVQIHTCTVEDDGGLAKLAKVPVETMGIAESEFTDEALESLAQITSLRTLYLIKLRNITDEGIINLSKLSNLSELEIVRCDSVGDRSLSIVPKLDKLTTLSITGSSFTDSSIGYLAEAKRLTNLFLNDTRIGPDRLAEFVAQSSSLRHFTLHQQELNDRLLDEIGSSKIAALDLKESPILKKQLQHLSGNKSLEGLGVSAEVFTGIDTSSQTNPFDAESLSSLQQCPKLKALTIYKMPEVSDETIDALAKLKVSVLRFEICKLTDQQLLRLAEMSTLDKLIIRRAFLATHEGGRTLQMQLNKRWHKDCSVIIQPEAEYQKNK